MLSDNELEGQILAAMLNDIDCLNTGVAELNKTDFANSFYSHVFATMYEMWGKDEVVNAVTVYEKIKEIAKGKGVSWMALKEAFWAAGTFEQLTVKLKKLTKARNLMLLSQKIASEINNHSDADELASTIEDELYGLNAHTTEKIVTPKEQAMSILSTVEAQMDEVTRKKTSIYTTFGPLNYQTGGFEAGDLVIVSGPTGGGKTALTQNFIRDIALVQKLPCLHINTEMSEKQMNIRWAAMLAQDYAINNTTIRAGKITPEQLGKLTQDIDKMYCSELYSVTISDLTVPKMLSVIRRFVMQKKIRCVAVDYIGRMDTMNSNKDDWKQLLAAAKKLKTIGQQFNLVTFMVAQNDKSGNLAMASYMEHEADLHLHVRPLEPAEEMELGEPWNYGLVIKKGRSSPKGMIPVRFVGEKLKFVTNKEDAEKYAALAEQQSQQRVNQPIAIREISNSRKSARRYYD